MGIFFRHFFCVIMVITSITLSQANELTSISQAAQQGNSAAQYILGLMYHQGKGVEQNTTTATHWYTKAAEQNYLPAQYILINMYQTQPNSDEKTEALNHWITRLKSSPQQVSQIKEQENTQQLLSILTPLAVNNSTHAQYLLAMLLANNKQEHLANFWFLKAAQLGDKNAQYYIALVYDEKGGIINKTQALQWLEKAAEQNFIDAQIMLGSLFDQDTLLAPNHEKAFYWYEKAAKQNDASAQTFIASMYRDGRGVTQDIRQAFHWYEKAAQQGDTYGQYNLALMYETGQGVPKKLDLAHFWYQKAADQGHQASQLKLKMLKQAN